VIKKNKQTAFDLYTFKGRQYNSGWLVGEKERVDVGDDEYWERFHVRLKCQGIVSIYVCIYIYLWSGNSVGWMPVKKVDYRVVNIV